MTDETGYILSMFFLTDDFLLWTRFYGQLTLFLTDTNFIFSIYEVLPSLNVINSISVLKRENAFMIFCCQPIRLSQICLQKTTGKSGTDSGYNYI